MSLVSGQSSVREIEIVSDSIESNICEEPGLCIDRENKYYCCFIDGKFLSSANYTQLTMMKLLFASLLFFSGINYNNSSDETVLLDSKEYPVYICYSTTAKKYHYTKNCRGLNACKHDVKEVSLKDAKEKYSRTLCGWED